eukprot:Clim_evm1s241 gene=Clim_evmTU1s241
MDRFILMTHGLLDLALLGILVVRPTGIPPVDQILEKMPPAGTELERLLFYNFLWHTLARLGGGLSRCTYSICLSLTSYLLAILYFVTEIYVYHTIPADDQVLGNLGLLTALSIYYTYVLMSGTAKLN